MSKKALLMILDGWGLGDHGKDDVIFNTATPYWDYLMETYPHSQLQASGENVGPEFHCLWEWRWWSNRPKGLWTHTPNRCQIG